MCRFRHLLEAHDLGRRLFEEVQRHLAANGLQVATGKLIHAVVATPANVADSRVPPQLLHGRETRVWGDQAYRGQRAVIRQHAPRARDFSNCRYRQRGMVDLAERAKNRTKSKVRAKSLPRRRRGSSIRSGSSSGSSALPKCAIAGSTRTHTAAGDLRPRC